MNNEAKNFLRQFRSFIKFAETISEADDLEIDIEQLVQKREDALQALVKANELVTAKHGEALKAAKEVENSMKQAKANLEDAAKEGEKILNLARNKAIDITMDADAQADKAIQAAKKEVEGLHLEVDKLDKRRIELLGIQAKLEAAIADLKKKFL